MKAHIDVVCPHTLVIAEAFREWEESRREIDLPAVDKDANLVVIELNDERGPVLRADDSRRTAS